MHFTDEDFYVFIVAHEYKHFADLGGTGIRNLVDRYVYLNTRCYNCLAKIGGFQKNYRSRKILYLTPEKRTPVKKPELFLL